MMIGKPPVKFVVAQIGDLDRCGVENATGLANRVQRSFCFEWYPDRLPLNKKRYQLPNRSFDLDSATLDAAERLKLSTPIIFMTSAPYGVRERGSDPEYLFFSDFGLSDNPFVSVVSTQLWDNLPPPRRPQPYILQSLATAALSFCGGFEFHEETHGCLFDYCDDVEHIDRSFTGTGLCETCGQQLNQCLRSGQLNVEQVAAVLKLRNRAAGRKMCFVAMPFGDAFRRVHEIIVGSLSERGWTVQRADEMRHPRCITDAIVMAMLSSDLVVAELTGGNPNVFYEVGFAHAMGCDVVPITQEEEIPFDIANERAVMYKPDENGFASLAEELGKLAGSGSH
jgi:hypothetical protein